METTANTRKQESGKRFTMKKAAGIAGLCLAAWGLWNCRTLPRGLGIMEYEPDSPENAFKNDHARTLLMPVLYCYILCIV